MTIHFWHGLQQGPVLDSFKQIVWEWNSGQSEYQVELKDFKVYGDPAKEALAKSPEEQPQLVLAPEFMTSKMMEALQNKKVLPISQLLDSQELKEIPEIIKRTFGDKEGQLVSLPLNPACGVIFTNKEMLQELGLDPNYVPASMEELEQVCQKLISKKISENGYTCAWPAAYCVEIPAAQQNLPLITPENGKLGYGEYQLNKPWLKQHLLNLRQQQKEGIFKYSGKDNDSRKPFVERKVAFFMQGSTHYALIKKEVEESGKPFEIGCGPLPTLVKGQTQKYAQPLGGGSVWVLDNSTTQKMIEGVRAFTNYLASKQFQERWHKETAYVPVRSSLPEELKEYYQEHPIHKAVVAQTIEAILGQYSFGLHARNYAEARKELFDLIEKVVNTEEDIETLLQNFDNKYSLSS